MSANAKPLAGLRVGISISESDDLEARGFTPSAMNRLTCRLNDALLAAGATVVFGHDWREDGVMDAVCRSALWSSGYPEPDAPPPILNLLPWPDATRIDHEVLLRLHQIIDIRSAGLPEDLAEEAPRAVEDQNLRRYLRSRGLTHLRRRLTEECTARVCLGGRTRARGRKPPRPHQRKVVSRWRISIESMTRGAGPLSIRWTIPASSWGVRGRLRETLAGKGSAAIGWNTTRTADWSRAGPRRR